MRYEYFIKYDFDLLFYVVKKNYTDNRMILFL